MTNQTDVDVVAAWLATHIGAPTLGDPVDAAAWKSEAINLLVALTANGRKVVGREATGAMLDAGYEAWSDKNHDCSDWSWPAMHDAAPPFTGGE